MKHLLTAAAVILAGTTALNAQFNNPALDKHSDDVTFYVNFDDSPNAVLSSGEGAPYRTVGKVDYADGISGKALKVGNLCYRGDQNIDLSATGTMIFWVAPDKEYKTPPANQKEPGFIAVALSGGKETYTLYSGKMGGQPWRKGPFNTYVQYAYHLKITHVNCIPEKWHHISDWDPKTWKMLTVTWEPGKFSVTTNDETRKVSTLKVPMTAPSDEIRLGFGKDALPYQMLLDEVIILKKVLTEEEVKEIYNLSLKQMKK